MYTRAIMIQAAGRVSSLALHAACGLVRPVGIAVVSAGAEVASYVSSYPLVGTQHDPLTGLTGHASDLGCCTISLAASTPVSASAATSEPGCSSWHSSCQWYRPGQQSTPLAPFPQQHTRRLATAAANASEETVIRGVVGRRKEPVRVVIIKDVPPKRRVGQIRMVPAGKMRHSLFPMGLADYATPENMKKYAPQLEAARKAQAEEEQSKEGQQRALLALFDIISNTTLHISRRFTQQPDDKEMHMVGKVTAEDVRQTMLRQHQLDVHTSQVLMDRSIREFGTFSVPLNFRNQQDKQIELLVTVTPVKRLRRTHNVVLPIEFEEALQQRRQRAHGRERQQQKDVQHPRAGQPP